MKQNKLFENAVAIALTQVVSYVLPLITLPYLSRVLGAEKFGLVFWAQSCIVYFNLITDYGFNWSATKEIAIVKDDTKKISEIFSSVMGVKFFLVIGCFLILTILIQTVPLFSKEWLLFYLTFFLTIGNSIYPIWYFQGIEHMKYVTLMNIISKSIFLILIFLFIKSPDDYLFVALLNSLGFIIAGILSIVIAIKRFNLKIRLPSLVGIKHQLINSFGYFTANISNTIYTNTNSFVLGLIASPLCVGYYVAAEKIFTAIHMLTSPVGTAIFPHIAKTRNVKLYKRIFYVTISVIFLISLFVFIFAKQFVIIFYGQNMLPAYIILRIFCITVIFSSISGLLGYPLLGAMGYPNVVNKSLPVAAVVHCLLLIMLYKFNELSMTRIAYLTILPYSIMLTMRIIGIMKYNLWNYKESN